MADDVLIPRTAEFGTADEVAAEEAFASAIEANVDAAITAYEERFGKVINTDSAKLLYAPYADDPELRVQFSRAVYGPAKWLMNELFERRVRDPEVKDVLFLTGGTASGKSSWVQSAGAMWRDADLVVDGTLSNRSLTESQITSVIRSGKRTRVVFVACDVRIALKRAVLRALQIHRTLSLKVFAGSHFHCRRTMDFVLNEFGASPQFRMTVVENSIDLTPIPQTEISRFIKEGQIPKLETLVKNVETWFQEICEEYESDHGSPIPDHVRQAFLTEGRDVSRT